mgnify:FL=1
MKCIEKFYLDIFNFNDYIDVCSKKEIKIKYKSLYTESKRLRYFFNYKIRKFKKDYVNLDKIIKNANNLFIENQIIKYETFFSNIDGKKLDREQMRAVITDDNYNLIAAGAGSGKTLTMISKVKYLTEIKNIKPEEILCIS